MTEDERKVLEFVGAPKGAIWSTFGFSPTRYWQILYALIERPDVEQAEPALVHRAMRLRDERGLARARRRFRPVG